MDPLEQMLIEHPSMSVYQMRRALNEEEEEEEEPLGADEDASRSLLLSVVASTTVGVRTLFPLPHRDPLCPGRRRALGSCPGVPARGASLCRATST